MKRLATFLALFAVIAVLSCTPQSDESPTSSNAAPQTGSSKAQEPSTTTAPADESSRGIVLIEASKSESDGLSTFSTTLSPSAEKAAAPSPNSALGLGSGGGTGGIELRRARGAAKTNSKDTSRSALQNGNQPYRNDRKNTPAEDPDVEEDEVANDKSALEEDFDPTANPRQGELWARFPEVEGKPYRQPVAFPLKHTAVKAEIAGFVASTTITQTYGNDFEEAIEAIYVFPLPENAAVNDFKMVIGERVIVGMIRKRDEAKAIYDEARSMGYTASLLEQEQANIFVQSVANIAPKENIDIEITYFNRLKLDGATYEYRLPMVVGPRYSKASEDPAKVERISTVAVPADVRSGHDISVDLTINAGAPIENFTSVNHDVKMENIGGRDHARITLKNKDELANRDFTLRWDVMGADVQSSILTHAKDGDGVVSLMLTPPREFNEEDLNPRELIFLVDISGSMRNRPMDLCRSIITRALDRMRAGDTFNIVFFASGNGQLFERSMPTTPANVQAAKDFMANLKAGGGTEMLAGVKRVLDSERTPGLARMILFLTDGYISAVEEILETVKTNTDKGRFFAFGVGGSINTYLIEGIGRYGRGHASVVYPREENADMKAVDDFYSRIDAPILTDIKVDWGTLPIDNPYPTIVNDLMAGHPLSLIARYKGSGSGTVTISAFKGGQPVQFTYNVTLPANSEDNAALAPIWARARIADLEEERIEADAETKNLITEEIVQTALAYRLVSEGTSFVAVDSSRKVGDGDPKKVDVPVEQPEGVDRETTRPGEIGPMPPGGPMPPRR